MGKVERFLTSSPKNGTFDHMLLLFLQKQQKRGISPHTIARLYFNLHPIGQEISSVSELSRSWLNSYVSQQWLRGYAASTMRSMVGDLRHFFRWGKRKGYFESNLAKRLKPVRRRHGRRKSKAASEDAIQQTIKHLAEKLQSANLVYRDVFRVLQVADGEWGRCESYLLRDLFILTFLYETGARVGELAKLGSKAMNDTTRNPASAYMLTVIGKTHDRDRFFTERTAELWRAWSKIRPNECSEYAVIGWGRGRDPHRLEPRAISDVVLRKSADSGAKPFRANALRHAKVGRSRRKVGLEMARLLVDHSDLRTTEGYASVEDDEFNAAIVSTGLTRDFFAQPSFTPS